MAQLNGLLSLKLEVQTNLGWMEDLAMAKSTEVAVDLISVSVTSCLDLAGLQVESDSKSLGQFHLLRITKFGNVTTKVHVKMTPIVAWFDIRLGRECDGGGAAGHLDTRSKGGDGWRVCVN